MTHDTAQALLAGQTIPISVITGFLGSGKTTLLNRLLRDPTMRDCLVLINELGEIGIDHFAVQEVHEQVVLLESGCLCCALRVDLVESLRSLSIQRLRGEIPPFRRIVVETTGLADPVPIVHTLLTDPLIAERFRLASIVTTADSGQIERQLAANPEAVRQVVVADALVLTKLDLVGGEFARPRLDAVLHALNPGAEIIAAAEFLPAMLDDGGTDRGSAARSAHRISASSAAPSGDDAGRHTGEIQTISLHAVRPIPWDLLSCWLRDLLAEHGASMLRTKGLVNVEGRTSPVLIDGVQHVFYPARELSTWPDEDRSSRFVFIVRDLDVKVISDRFTNQLIRSASTKALSA